MSTQFRFTGLRFWLLFFGCAAMIAGLGVIHHPVYQEWSVGRLTLTMLVTALPQHQLDDRWLYFTGLRLNEASRHAEAIPVLQQATRLDPNSTRIRVAWTEAQLAEGRLGEAFSQLKQFVGTHPLQAMAHLLLGRFYLSLKTESHSLEELEQATRLDPKLAEAWSALASARTQFLNNTSLAAEAAEKAYVLAPNDVENTLQLAYLKGLNGDGKARNLYEQVVKLVPDRADVLRQYADYLLQCGGTSDVHKAESMARRAVDKDPDAPLGQLSLGNSLLRTGRWQEAIPPLTRAAQLMHNKPEPALYLSNAYGGLKKIGEKNFWRREFIARQHYQSERQRLSTEISLRPRNRDLLEKMAFLSGTHGDVNDAVRYRSLATGKVQDSPEVLGSVAQNLIQSGFTLPALTLARRALETAPENPIATKVVRQATGLLSRTEHHDSEP